MTTQHDVPHVEDRVIVEAVVGAVRVPELDREVNPWAAGSPQEVPVVKNTASLCPTGFDRVNTWLPPDTMPVTLGEV